MDRMERRSAVTLNAATNACVHIVGKSIIGTRDYQQDAFYTCFNGETCMAVVCDGMGGAEHGEMASRCAIEMLAKDYDAMTGTEDPYHFLRNEALRMDKAVYELKDETGRRMDSGTTVVAVIVRNSKIWWLSVGDSRIYVVRKNQFSPVNKEHNYRYRLDQRLEEHVISREEYQAQAIQAEALISYIGMNGLELIDQNSRPFEMQHMDRFLLCSDGLIKALGEEKVKEILMKHPLDINASVEELIDYVEKCGKKHIDNTTVVLLSYE